MSTTLHPRSASQPSSRSFPRKKLGRRFLALKISGGAVVICFLFGELWCRWFTDMPWLGISRTLFVPEVFGASAGNPPSSVESSFGLQVHLDELGFRIDPEYAETPAGAAHSNIRSKPTKSGWRTRSTSS